MRMAKVCIVSALVTLGCRTFAHNGSILGVLYDSKDNSTLPGGLIVLDDSIGKATVTNQLGGFEFNDLKSGVYHLLLDYIGYEKQVIKVTVADNKTSYIKIYAVPVRLELDDIGLITRAKLNEVNTDQIQLRAINSSQDVLTVVPGLFIGQHAGGGKAEQLFLRGFDLDHGTDISVSVDGMPVNMVSHAHGQGYADLHFVIPELIETTSFETGLYDTEHGNFATAGYVDFYTKDNLEKTTVKLEKGAFNRNRGVVMLDLSNKKNNRKSFYTAGEFLFSDGYFESLQNFKRVNLFAKYTDHIDDNKKLSLSLSNFRSSWDASGQIPLRAVENGSISRFGAIDDTEGGFTGRTNLNAEYLHFVGENSKFQSNLSVSRYDFELFSNFTFFLNDPVNGDQIHQYESRTIYNASSNYSTEKKWGSMIFTSKVGVQLRYDDVDDIELSHTKNRKETLSYMALGQVDETNIGVFAEEQVKISDRINVLIGLRYDDFSFNYIDELDSVYNRKTNSEQILSPKFKLRYSLNDRIELFAKAGSGFHSNDSRVSVVQKNGVLPRAVGGDLGWKWQVNDQTTIQSSIWWLYLEQEFVYVGDEAVIEPSGKTRRSGVDVSVRSQITDWIYADVDVNITKPRSLESVEGENFIPLAPKFTSIGGLTFKGKQSPWNGSLRCRWLGNRPANEDNSIVASGYTLIDASINYSTDKFEIGFTAQNLLNQKWREAQFETESRLQNEVASVTEIHFTPGTPTNISGHVNVYF